MKLSRLLEQKSLLIGLGCLSVASSLCWLAVDQKMPKPIQLSVVALTVGLGYGIKKELEEKDQTEFEELNQNHYDYLKQFALIATETKTEEVPYPTLFVSDKEDPTGIVRNLQVILDDAKVRNEYRGFTDAPRFYRYKFSVNLGSTISTSERLAKKIQLGLGSTRLILKDPPLVTTDGLLNVDLPKPNFTSITYTESVKLIRDTRDRIIGFDSARELITHPISEQTAFTIVGGMTRSGKSVWMRQDALERALNCPNDTFYFVEFKEGSFGRFEGFKRAYNNSVAYDVDEATERINALYEILEKRMTHARSLTPSDRRIFIDSCHKNAHNLYFDEYADDKYTATLEQILKKGSAYGIRAVIGTQQFNRTKSSGESAVSGVIVEQSSIKICFKVLSQYSSMQILGRSDGTNLLGFGDGFYQGIDSFEPIRFQSVLYTDDELDELFATLEYNTVNTPAKKSVEPIVVNQEMPRSTVSLTKKYIKPPTKEWEVLTAIENKPIALTAIANKTGLTRDKERLNRAIALFLENGLIREVKNPNGRGKAYQKN